MHKCHPCSVQSSRDHLLDELRPRNGTHLIVTTQCRHDIALAVGSQVSRYMRLRICWGPMTAVPQYAPPTLVTVWRGLGSGTGGWTDPSWALRSCSGLSDRCYKIRGRCGAMEVKSTVRCMLKDTLLGRHTVWSTQCMRMCAIQCDYMRRCEAVEEEDKGMRRAQGRAIDLNSFLCGGRQSVTATHIRAARAMTRAHPARGAYSAPSSTPPP